MITDLETLRNSPKTYSNNGKFRKGVGRKSIYWYQEATYILHTLDDITIPLARESKKYLRK